MSYPIAPFVHGFNTEMLAKKSQNENTDRQKELTELFRWLCTAPNISSYRINTLLATTNDVLLEMKRAFKNISGVSVEACPYLPDVIIAHNTNVNELDLIRKPLEVVIDVRCAESVLRGAQIFAPGIMGMLSGITRNDKVSIYADLENKCRKGFPKVFNSEKKLFIGNGIVKMTRSDLFGEDPKPSGVAVEVYSNISGCILIEPHFLPESSCLLQNLPSIVCTHVLNPIPGEHVLDMCAAPGNKSTHIAAFMKNEGTLVAIDKTPSKIKQLKANCAKFKAKVSIYQADSTKIFDDTFGANSEGGPPFSSECFDRILLDAPCSALGKRPQLYNKTSEKVIKSFVPLQRKLLRNAAHLLKINGRLVYSTCTITEAENEVPKLTTLSNHDTTHILREAFQDFFSAQTFPKNIANNVEKYNLKMIALKENGMHANNYQQSITTYLEDVTRTEEKLLQRHAEYFIAKDSIINDPPVNEKNKLKRMPIAIRELSAATRQKHGLLDIHHLLPPLPERVLEKDKITQRYENDPIRRLEAFAKDEILYGIFGEQ
ncbi:16S rRNA methyltransferase RsmB/F [Popillia japonica]|uniref:16S rRNA methyltransferase RsmB/F n=1 Tax=Popillia japonica TaxID=7064 RepID=A0AAW1IWF3_POPJA